MRNVALIVGLLWGFMFHSSQAFNVFVESDYRESSTVGHKIPCGATTPFKVTVSGIFDSTETFEFEWKYTMDVIIDVNRRRLLELGDIVEQSTESVQLTGKEGDPFTTHFFLYLRCNDNCEPDGFPYLSCVTVTSGEDVAYHEFYPSCFEDVAASLQVELEGGFIDLNCGEEREFSAKVTGMYDDDGTFDYDWTVYDIDKGGEDDKLDEGKQATVYGTKGTQAEANTNFVIACTEFDGSSCYVAGSVGDVVGEDTYQASEIQFRASRGSDLAQSAGILVVNCVPPPSHPLTVTLPEGPVMIPCGEKEIVTATVSGPSDALGHMLFSWEAYDYDEDIKTHVFLKNDILDANQSHASAPKPFDLATADVPFSLECSRRGLLLGSGPDEILPAEVFFQVTTTVGIQARNPSVLHVDCEKCDDKLKPLALKGPSVIACGDKGDFELDVEGITDEGYTPRLMYGWYAYNTEGTKEMLLVQNFESTEGPSQNTVIQHTAKFSLECDSDCKFVDGSSLASIKVYAYQDPRNVPYLTIVKPEKVRCGEKESSGKLPLGSTCKKTKECEKGLKCKGKKGDKQCKTKKKNNG